MAIYTRWLKTRRGHSGFGIAVNLKQIRVSTCGGGKNTTTQNEQTNRLHHTIFYLKGNHIFLRRLCLHYWFCCRVTTNSKEGHISVYCNLIHILVKILFSMQLNLIIQ